ncbi:hypothetical protein D3C80_1875140 [compost metagenome]
MAGAWVQVQLEAIVLLGAPVFQSHRWADFRNAVAAALLAGRDGDFLPLLELFLQALAVEFNAAALGK